MDAVLFICIPLYKRSLTLEKYKGWDFSNYDRFKTRMLLFICFISLYDSGIGHIIRNSKNDQGLNIATQYNIINLFPDDMFISLRAQKEGDSNCRLNWMNSKKCKIRSKY